VTARMPRGLGYQGQKLWREVIAEYDLDSEPAKLRILFDACKTADAVDELDKAAAKSPLTVRGSAGQEVIHPARSEARFTRGLLAQLLARLNFAPPEEC